MVLGLVLEQETSNEARRIEVTRKTTPEGALVALRAAFYNERQFGRQLWETATASTLAIDEVAALCDIAALVWDSIDSPRLSFKLPRMWQCEYLGKAQLRFTSYGPYRTVGTQCKYEAIAYRSPPSQRIDFRYSSPSTSSTELRTELRTQWG